MISSISHFASNFKPKNPLGYSVIAVAGVIAATHSLGIGILIGTGYLGYKKIFPPPQRALLSYGERELVKQNPSLDRMIKEKYNVELINVNNLEEAEIVGIGELHAVDRHLAQQGKIVDHLNRNKDGRLLLEGVENDGEAYRFINLEGRQCKYVASTEGKFYGWDLPNEKRYIPILSTSKLYCILIGDLLLRTILNTSSVTHYIFSCVEGIVAAWVIQSYRMINRDLLPRNESMCNSFGNHLTKAKKVFAIAGADHFPSDTNSENTRCIREFLQDKKAAILIPNDLFKSFLESYIPRDWLRL